MTANIAVLIWAGVWTILLMELWHGVIYVTIHSQRDRHIQWFSRCRNGYSLENKILQLWDQRQTKSWSSHSVINNGGHGYFPWNQGHKERRVEDVTFVTHARRGTKREFYEDVTFLTQACRGSAAVEMATVWGEQIQIPPAATNHSQLWIIWEENCK